MVLQACYNIVDSMFVARIPDSGNIVNMGEYAVNALTTMPNETTEQMERYEIPISRTTSLFVWLAMYAFTPNKPNNKNTT